MADNEAVIGLLVIGIVSVGTVFWFLAWVFDVRKYLYGRLWSPCVFCKKHFRSMLHVRGDYNAMSYHHVCFDYALHKKIGWPYVQNIRTLIAKKEHTELSAQVTKNKREKKKFDQAIDRLEKRNEQKEFQELHGEKGLDFIIDKDKEEQFDRKLH